MQRDEKGFTTVEREWKPGDVLSLHLPMGVGLEANREEGGSPYGCIFYGPLLMVHALPEVDENTPEPDAKWSYALDIPGSEVLARAAVERRPMPERWRWQRDAPLTVTVPARDVYWEPVPLREPGNFKMPSRTHETSWPGNPTMPYDLLDGGKLVDLKLIPYGCAKFRLSMFPLTHATAWAVPPPAKSSNAQEDEK